MDYKERIKAFIIDNFMFGDGAGLTDDASLLENRIIDSQGILELIYFMEQNFGIKVEPEELSPKNMDSIDNLNEYLMSKLKASPLEAH